MKRMMCAVLMVALLMLAFSSCRESVNMETLTKYQQMDFVAQAVVSFGEKKYNMDIEKAGDELTFSLDGVAFAMSENGCFLKIGELKIPIEQGAKLFKFSQMKALFNIRSQGTWKIERSAPGGVSVYICQNEDTGEMLYIDSGTHLPLKIICGEVEADIIYFQTKS